MPAQLPARLPLLSVPELFRWSGLRFAGLAGHLHGSWGAGPWGQIFLIFHRWQLVGTELCAGWAYVGRQTWPVAVNQGEKKKKAEREVMCIFKVGVLCLLGPRPLLHPPSIPLWSLPPHSFCLSEGKKKINSPQTFYCLRDQFPVPFPSIDKQGVPASVLHLQSAQAAVAGLGMLSACQVVPGRHSLELTLPEFLGSESDLYLTGGLWTWGSLRVRCCRVILAGGGAVRSACMCLKPSLATSNSKFCDALSCCEHCLPTVLNLGATDLSSAHDTKGVGSGHYRGTEAAVCS